MKTASIILIALSLFLGTALRAQRVQRIKITELEKTITESKTPLIINFWATYCVPCLEEMPYFQQAVAAHQEGGVKLIFVSLDMQEAFPEQIKKTITKQNIIAPVQWLDETNADYFCPRVDSTWYGGLPATLFINNKTGYRKFYEQKVSLEKLEEEIAALVKKGE